jgi:murein DD-endopeptidase MepM/ murein hydrolase activator NlpD
MNRTSVALSTAIAAALLLLCGGLVGLPMFMFGQSQAHAAACAILPAAPVDAGPGVDHWDAQQVANAAVIVSVGKSMNVPPRGFVIALATAMQESTLYNLANTAVPRSLLMPHEGQPGHDHDSVGLFQQRPLPPDGQGAWGTVQELMTPSITARKFYSALLKVDGWETMRLTDAAQAVQRSGLPEAYQEHEAAAERLAAHVLGLPNIDIIGGGSPLAPCGPGAFGPVPVGPGGWVPPVRGVIVSPFGPRGGRLHAGVDLGAPDIRGKPIRAASAGVVETAQCQSGSGTCDRDGGIGVGGCGWYVDIRHTGNIVTRYCHMIQRPFVHVGQSVAAGEVIGLVGSSGNSSGPHLHFEVHLNVLPGPFHAHNENAIDPVPFMRTVGAALN